MLVDDGVTGDATAVRRAPTDLASLAVGAVGVDIREDVGGAHGCGVGESTRGTSGDAVVNPRLLGDDDLGLGPSSLAPMRRKPRGFA
jgi:hypothetical protein